MKPAQLISIGLFTMAIVITVYAWSDRLRGSSAAINEAFTDTVVSDELIAKLQQANEPVPTDKDAVAAHQTLLRYIELCCDIFEPVEQSASRNQWHSPSLLARLSNQWHCRPAAR